MILIILCIWFLFSILCIIAGIISIAEKGPDLLDIILLLLLFWSLWGSMTYLADYSLCMRDIVRVISEDFNFKKIPY